MELVTNMVPAALPTPRVTERIRADGRAQPAFREELRRIPSWRNALSVVGLYVQVAVIVWASVRWAPWIVPVTFILMGRVHARRAKQLGQLARIACAELVDHRFLAERHAAQAVQNDAR